MKHWYTDGVNEIFIDDYDTIPEGYQKGYSEKRRDSISASRKGKSISRGKEKVKHVYYTDGKVSIRIPFNQDPPEGFYPGRIVRKRTEEQKKLFNERRRQTCLERYGDSNYNNVPANKDSKLKNHGSENYNNREKASKTCLEKYGVDSVSKVQSVKDRIRNTCIERYGIAGSFANPDILAKAIQHSTSEECQEKRQATCMARYGVPYAGSVFGLPQSRNTEPNLSFKQLLIDNGFVVDDSNNREFAIGRYRYDFVIDRSVIEINPSATHNSTWSIYGDSAIKPKTYHADKSRVAVENGYRCIHVFDWDDPKKIISLLKPRAINIYARSCDLDTEPLNQEVREFLNLNHLQGSCRYDICLVLKYEGRIVSCMTFGKPRYNKSCQYELLRYCSSENVIGGAEKLFSHFINDYKPESIVSYCDMSKFDGKTYEKLNFRKVSQSPSKHWYNMTTKQHITDNLLRQRGYDQLFNTDYGKGTSNEELMRAHGFVEIYDAGQATYIWSCKTM